MRTKHWVVEVTLRKTYRAELEFDLPAKQDEEDVEAMVQDMYDNGELDDDFEEDYDERAPENLEIEISEW